MNVACARGLWVPDAQRARCTQCHATFGTLTRRSHCRRCGDVFCGDCVSFSLGMVDAEGCSLGQQKVCRACHVSGTDTQDDLHLLSASSTCRSSFTRVRSIFLQHFVEGRDIGAQLCCYVGGECVIDLAAGEAKPGRWGHEAEPMGLDTLVCVFSTSKILSSLCVAIAVDRGWVRYEDTIAQHWPEFAKFGKDQLTVAELLRHESGLARSRPPVKLSMVNDLEQLEQHLVNQVPEVVVDPDGRQQTAYMAFTRGFYVSALIRRVDPAGRSVRAFLAEEIARPLKISSSLYIGVDEAQAHRVARHATKKSELAWLMLQDDLDVDTNTARPASAETAALCAASLNRLFKYERDTMKDLASAVILGQPSFASDVLRSLKTDSFSIVSPPSPRRPRSYKSQPHLVLVRLVGC